MSQWSQSLSHQVWDFNMNPVELQRIIDRQSRNPLVIRSGISMLEGSISGTRPSSRVAIP